MRLIIALTATAVVAATLTASPLAGTQHHRGWSSLTLTERRAVVVREIRSDRQEIRWWIRHRSTRLELSALAGPYHLCSAIGIRVPSFVCVRGQRLVHALRVLRHIDALLAVHAAPKIPDWWLRQAACIRSREGAWTTNTGNGYYGAYQFLLSTWQSVGGTGYPNESSPAEQTFRAWLVWTRDGGSWREWGTARACGLA